MCFHIKSLLFSFWNLVFSSAALRELENNVAAGQSSVNLAISIEAVVNTTTLLLIENDLDGLAAVLLGADTLANNLNGVDDVGEDGVVDSSQSTGTRTLLSEGVARADGALGAGEDTARSNDDNVAVGELLLELTSQSVGPSVSAPSFQSVWCFSQNIPLLNLVETLEERDGNEDGNSLLAMADLDL